jgi:hypothetical protein
MQARYIDQIDLLEAYLTGVSERLGADRFHAVICEPSSLGADLHVFTGLTHTSPSNSPPGKGQVEMLHFSFPNEMRLLAAMWHYHRQNGSGEFLLFGPRGSGIRLNGARTPTHMYYDEKNPPVSWEMGGAITHFAHSPPDSEEG